jgi:hypothetical protein
MIRRQQVVQDFFPEAEAMRESLDVRFRERYANEVPWHYFCVPRLYTYLRTAPREVFQADLFGRFMQSLQRWCMDSLGLTPMGVPALHLMVNGCKLELHSDFHNGTWGYVYSLTRWQTRRFSGGETLLMRDGIPSYKKHHAHGEELYELIPAQFNQLLVFDDRIVHGTPVIEGSMDPLDGRIALVGHLRATSPVVSGPLTFAAVRSVIFEALPQLNDRIKNYRDVQGTITFRLSIAAAGTVESVAILTDNLVTAIAGYDPSDAVVAVRSAIQHAMSRLRFPAAAGKSSVIIPVLVPLPDLRPIEIAVAHELSREAVYEWAEAKLAADNVAGLKGSWEADVFVVREPIAGSIRIEPHQVAMSFDPPMWVPSQRKDFELMLRDRMKVGRAD